MSSDSTADDRARSRPTAGRQQDEASPLEAAIALLIRIGARRAIALATKRNYAMTRC
jgi:hypothetical protein